LLATGSLRAEQTVRLFFTSEDAFEGYTLFTPWGGFNAIYLIDNDGTQVHTWFHEFDSAGVPYLLEDGSLLRLQNTGAIQRLAWTGEVMWEYQLPVEIGNLHHDIEPLPNGNVLLIGREEKTHAEAVAAGRDPAMAGSFHLDMVVEVEPVGLTDGNIVWEWHPWDHMVQDFDPTKDNFGVIADNPGRLDINHSDGPGAWGHFNGVDYNAELDQIAISVRHFNEAWVVDHDTTTVEAAGPAGELLYRWGNPSAYDRGGPEDQQLFGQHDARWVEPGHPGAGNLTAYSNFDHTVVEITPPVDASGNYSLAVGEPYGPVAPVWSFGGIAISNILSGANRLPNGNTLICSGIVGEFLEVAPDFTEVWKYVSPIGNGSVTEQGDDPGNNEVYKIHRYPPDYPAFVGKSLTPGDPIEFFTPPSPVPDGSGATQPMTVRKGPTNMNLRLAWDNASCPAERTNLLVGDLADVGTYGLQDAVCSLGSSGLYNWQGVPAGDLYFLLLGEDQSGCYESSWGADSTGVPRNGGVASGMCGAVSNDLSQSCR